MADIRNLKILTHIADNWTGSQSVRTWSDKSLPDCCVGFLLSSHSTHIHANPEIWGIILTFTNYCYNGCRGAWLTNVWMRLSLQFPNVQIVQTISRPLMSLQHWYLIRAFLVLQPSHPPFKTKTIEHMRANALLLKQIWLTYFLQAELTNYKFCRLELGSWMNAVCNNFWSTMHHLQWDFQNWDAHYSHLS